MTTAAALTLFSECPACGYPVDDGEPCGQCAAMIDDGYLRRAAPASLASPAAVAEVTAELERVADAQAMQAARERRAASEWRMNQLCWCCEERRKCHPDPDLPGASDRWICKDCEAIPC